MGRKNEDKKANLNIKVQPRVLDEFQLACKLRGATMSGIIYLHMERIIKEAKKENAEAFAEIDERYADRLQPKRRAS